jgi:tetratricopeptide (TPR) repeat protein
MSTDLELDDETYQSIIDFCEDGDDLCAMGEFKQAIVEYNKAMKLIPLPHTDWGASTFVLIAIGDAYLNAGEPMRARKALEFAVRCPGGLGNPYLHLRLGQAAFDTGELDWAADELMRAYMGGGPEIFDGDDEKYLKFLGTRADLPD